MEWDILISFIEEINETSPYFEAGNENNYFSKHKLKRAHVENAFIAATRHDTQQKLKCCLNRKELHEFLARLCVQWINIVYGYGPALSDHLDEFFKIYVDPWYDKSTMFTHREEIRKN